MADTPPYIVKDPSVHLTLFSYYYHGGEPPYREKYMVLWGDHRLVLLVLVLVFWDMGVE